MDYYAHSGNGSGRWHPLVDHLRSVGAIAGAAARNAPWKDEARLAGLLHDLGKYADRFQARLHGEDQGLDHWSQGAWLALTEHRAIAAALAIQGHHVGLQMGNADSLRRLMPQYLVASHPFRLELSEPDPQRVKARAETDGLVFAKPNLCALTGEYGWDKAVAAMLDVRLLFSCLVDADFLDTEAHFKGDADGKRFRTPGPKLDAAAALTALEAHMQDSVRASSQADESVRKARESLWQAANSAAQRAPGLFTLTAPTGSGKTLAMLKFALQHAANNGLNRVVVVVPFLTIIEQTAQVYQAVFTGFPDHYVLEHHSLADLGKEGAQGDAEGEAERQRRLLAENWDAPVVLTTNVQLLESLFSNRPSSCRKLHSLMESVILFDEAQSLPQTLAVPTLACLSHLSSAYRSTVVFATATQPAFDTLDDAVKQHAVSGWKPGQIVEDHAPMFEALRRVEVTWPEAGQERNWDDLSKQLRTADRVLCVVNLKRHALALMDALAGEQGLFHLSTNLCPEHRRDKLDTVRKQLGTVGAPCRLISTQCVEAGVDVDFPKVFRAFGPLDAIAQAAGRCNREGRLPVMGKVTVFDPAEEGNWRRRYPTFPYYQAAQVTRTMLAAHGQIDINDPEVFGDYYRRLYGLGNPDMLDANLASAIQSLDFPAIAQQYRLIEHDAIQVLVPYSAKRSRYDDLRREAENKGINREWMRRAQGLAVSLYRPAMRHPAWGVLIPAKLRRGGVSDEWFILQDPRGEYYDDVFGLRLPDSDPIFIA